MKRREMMTLVPAALAVGAAPALSGVPPRTPVQIAYRKWEAARVAWEKAAEADDFPDEVGNDWCLKVYHLADDVLDQPSTGPLDFVYKLIAQSFHDQHDIGDCPRGEEIWAEARALIGGVA